MCTCADTMTAIWIAIIALEVSQPFMLYLLAAGVAGKTYPLPSLLWRGPMTTPNVLTWQS